MDLKLKLLRPVNLPTRSHRSAGLDLYAPHSVVIAPGGVEKIDLGFATEFAPEYVALLWDRSGMGSRGVHRFGGVIDGDYRGEWAVCLYNSTSEEYVINAGDKIVQVLFQRVEHPEIVLVGDVSESSRRRRVWVDRMIEVLHQFDVPPRFLAAFIDYARTGKLVGAELKTRVRTLDNFRDCVAAIDAQTGATLPPDVLQFTDLP